MTTPIQLSKKGLRYIRLRSNNDFFDLNNTGHRLKKLKHSTIVGLPDGSTTLTTHSKNLNLPELPLAAYKREIGPFQ